MTMSQAYYRMMFSEHGVTDVAFERCAFAAKLIVQLRVEELIKQMSEPPLPFVALGWEYLYSIIALSRPTMIYYDKSLEVYCPPFNIQSI